MARRLRILPRLLAATAVLAACHNDVGPRPSAGLFRRYVALGNSITAGFESGGINDSTQMHAYPVRLAQRMGAPFAILQVQKPGCPPPLVGPLPLTAERVGGESALPCAGFVTPVPDIVQNLAVPGDKIADVLSVPSGPLGALYNQIFHGRTLVQVMVDANPSLVSVWLGNNDALGAAESGDPARLTPLASFRASLDAIVLAIANQTSVEDAILIGVTDPQFAPVLQPGAYYWAVQHDPATSGLLPKPVSDNCAPQAATGQPNPLASNLVWLRVISDPAIPEISCADDAPDLLNAAEQQAITARVGEYNAAIQASAAAHGWIYVDPNPIVQGLLADPNRMRKCQGLSSAATPEQLQAAVQATCPVPSAPNFFGALLSFDGVHPSAQGQQVFADVLTDSLVARHGAP